MTDYLKKSFTVPSWKAPKECTHGWLDRKGKCVKCGEPLLNKVLDEQRTGT